jgi:TP901 family phage tail tape measure protein
MAKTISFKIRLEGSKEVLSEIDKISKALTNKLKASNLTIDEKGLKEATKQTEQLSKNVAATGKSISQVTKEMAALEAEGKQNTEQYKKLADEAGRLKVAQQQARDAAKRSEADLRNQVNLQKLLNGEIKATDLSQKQFFQALNSGLDQADPKYQELVQDFVRLKQEQKEFNDNLRIQQRLLESGSDVSGRFRKLNAELVNARSAYRDLTDEEIRSGKISDQLVKKYGLQSNSVKELENRVSQLDKELKETDAKLGNFQRNVGNYTSAFRGAASALAQIGIGVGLSELAQTVRRTIGDFAEFEAQVKAVQIASGATAEQIKELEEDARRLGATTRFTAKEVADLQENFARLGFSPDEIKAVTEATLELAITTGEDLASASEVAAGTLRGYRLQAAETARVTNVMALSFSSSALNLERFRESQKTVAPIAAQLGVDVEATTAALGKLADNQISGSQAGTSFRRILAELGNENSKLSKRLGVTVNDTASFQQALTALSESSIGTAEAQELVGDRAFGSLLVLKENADAIKDLNGELNNASEAYARLADGSIVPLTEELKNSGESFEVLSAGQRGAAIASDTLSGDLATLRSAIAEVGLKFGEATKGGLRDFVQFLTTAIPNAAQAIGNFINALLSIPRIIRENKVEIIALTVAIVSLNKSFIAAAISNSKLLKAIKNSTIATKLQAAATKTATFLQTAYSTAAGVLTGKIKLATLATRAQAAIQGVLNKVLNANPIGLVIAAVAGLVAIFARLYKSSQTLRSGIAGTFGALKKIVGNVVGGIVKQLTGFGQLLKGVFTLNLDDIKAGAKRYAEGVGDVFLRAGEGAGDAFNKGFDAKTALDLNNAIEDAIAQGDSQIGDKVNDQIVTALEKGQITNAQADDFQAKLQEGIDKATKVEETSIKDTGFNLGKDFGSGVALGISDSEKDIIQARKKALENIRKLETGLITNEFDAQVVQAETSADSDISGLVGDPEQIRRQEALIKAQLGVSLGEIEQARINSFAQTIERAQQAAANEIALLTGSPNEIEQQSFIIRQSLVTQIEGISSDRDAAINQAIADAQARRDAEIAALTGSPEEIEANAATIRNTYSKVITDLGTTRKQLTQAQEIELVTLRKQITQELGGELNADLEAAGAEELRILQENVNKRLDVINKETERRKEALKDAAELQRQRIQLELASETNPRRKEQLNKQLTDLEKQLQSDLLQVDKDGADKRLGVAKTLVSDSTKLAQDLADVEKRIDKQKNDELIRNARQRAAEIEEIEKAAKDALIQGAFDFAGAIGQDIIEGERARVDAQIDLERSRADASAEQQEKSTRKSYEKQIAAAEGNAEKQEQLRQELSDKLTSIDRNRAAKERSIQRREAIERKKIARKEAIIQGALAVVRALASPAGPAAAVAAGIATAVQLAIIEAQRFEEGGALSGAVGNFIAAGADVIGTSSLPDIQGSSPRIPTEGVIQGPRHTAGGVKASFNGTAVEAEGGEYKLKNGGETYIINRKSTKLFRPQLDSLRGNVHKFDPVKRVIASNINSFGGNGVKFAEGGALGVDVNKPLQVPQALQSISSGITREELNTSISRIYEGLGAISKSLDSKTDSIATNLQQEIAAINSRIDRIRVYNDPVEVVNAGNERIKADAAAEL